MMTVIDGLESNDLPMPIPTDALKTMVATAESPLAPGFLFGAHPGMAMRGFHGRGDDDRGFQGRGDDDWFGERGERTRGGWDERIDIDDDMSDNSADEDEGEADS